MVFLDNSSEAPSSFSNRKPVPAVPLGRALAQDVFFPVGTLGFLFRMCLRLLSPPIPPEAFFDIGPAEQFFLIFLSQGGFFRPPDPNGTKLHGPGPLVGTWGFCFFFFSFLAGVFFSADRRRFPPHAPRFFAQTSFLHFTLEHFEERPAFCMIFLPPVEVSQRLGQVDRFFLFPTHFFFCSVPLQSVRGRFFCCLLLDFAALFFPLGASPPFFAPFFSPCSAIICSCTPPPFWRFSFRNGEFSHPKPSFTWKSVFCFFFFFGCDTLLVDGLIPAGLPASFSFLRGAPLVSLPPSGAS